MITLTDKDITSLEKDLSSALIRFSEGRLNDSQSKSLASKAISKIDFSNSALAHKGLNWYAKEIINIIDFESLATI